jgi:hypothetical protein
MIRTFCLSDKKQAPVRVWHLMPVVLVLIQRFARAGSIVDAKDVIFQPFSTLLLHWFGNLRLPSPVLRASGACRARPCALLSYSSVTQQAAACPDVAYCRHNNVHTDSFLVCYTSEIQVRECCGAHASRERLRSVSTVGPRASDLVRQSSRTESTTFPRLSFLPIRL